MKTNRAARKPSAPGSGKLLTSTNSSPDEDGVNVCQKVLVNGPATVSDDWDSHDVGSAAFVVAVLVS